TDQTAAHELVYGYVPSGYTLEEARSMRDTDRAKQMQASRASIVRHVEAMLGFKDRVAIVFDNGNLIRTHAKDGGVARAFEIAVFTEAFLRPLFCR
ncbi:urocanate hydratase, partial [Burkholderia pseudomallei]